MNELYKIEANLSHSKGCNLRIISIFDSEFCHLENFSCRGIIIPVRLLVELGPVPGHWSPDVGNVSKVETGNTIVDVRNEVLDCITKGVLDLRGKLG